MREGDLMLQFGIPTLIENRTLEDVDWFYKKADEASIYYTIHLDENMNIADFNLLVRDAYLETLRRTIEVAKQFETLKNKYGKKEQPLILNMHMHHGIYITLPDKKVQMYERDFDVYMECISQFVKLCEEWIGEADIQIAIENTKKYLESLKESKRYEYNPNSFHRMYKQSFRIIL